MEVLIIARHIIDFSAIVDNLLPSVFVMCLKELADSYLYTLVLVIRCTVSPTNERGTIAQSII